jgi:hypothetical protein
MFERNRCISGRSSLQFLLDVRYIATFGRGEQKKGSAESQPAITKGCLEQPIRGVCGPEFDTRLE